MKLKQHDALIRCYRSINAKNRPFRQKIVSVASWLLGNLTPSYYAMHNCGWYTKLRCCCEIRIMKRHYTT